MDTEQVHLERRGAQRFDLHQPVSVRLAGSQREGCGFTQNLSARGALLHTDLPVAESDPVEITLVMPSMITLAENMRVRCRGRVLRVLSTPLAKGCVAAVQIEGYEFLPEAERASSSFARIAALHEHPHEELGDAAPKESVPGSQRS